MLSTSNIVLSQRFRSEDAEGGLLQERRIPCAGICNSGWAYAPAALRFASVSLPCRSPPCQSLWLRPEAAAGPGQAVLLQFALPGPLPACAVAPRPQQTSSLR